MGRTFYRVMFIYNIDVEHEGGADLSFRYATDTELVVNQVIQDQLGRSYVVVSVSDETVPDPVNDDIRLGSATARPA
jgi:hypothetical protein